MKVDNIFKKRFVLFILSIVFIIFVLIISVITVKNSDFVKNDVQFDSGNLQLLYKNSEDNSQSGSIPMSFQQGIEYIPADKIQIVNKSDLSTIFSLCVQEFDVSSNNLGMNKLYYYINGDGGVLANTDGCIYTGKIKGNETIDLEVKIWPGLDLVSDDDQGKVINLKYILK